MPDNIIRFEVDADVAAIVRRAAARLGLAIIDHDNGADDHPYPARAFTVRLTAAIDAYRLGELTVSDPAWAMLMIRSTK